jgi:hypothetical protein
MLIPMGLFLSQNFVFKSLAYCKFFLSFMKARSCNLLKSYGRSYSNAIAFQVCCWTLNTTILKGWTNWGWKMIVFSILWCKWIGDHPQEDLTKSGYKSKWTLKTLKILTIFGNMLKLIVLLWWSIFFPQINVTTLGHFFKTKNLS